MPPPSIDLKPGQSPVVDQGMRNTCLPIAATGGHEALRPGERLSVEHLIDNAGRRGGISVDGATMRSMIDGLVVDGQCTDARWPYDGVTPLPRPNDLGDIFRAQGARVISVGLDELRERMSGGRSVVLGFQLTERFLLGHPTPIEAGPAGDAVYGLHAVLIVGYDDPSATVTVKNSWGTAWGSGGYAALTYGYVTRYGVQILAIEV